MEADRKYGHEIQRGQERKKKIWYKNIDIWLKHNNDAKNEDREEENKRIHNECWWESRK